MNKGRILILEDVAAVRRSIRTILVQAGYEAVEAETGDEALKILQASRRINPIHVILSALRLPPVDGSELIVHFRTSYPNIPVIALTSYTDVERAVTLMREGAMDFIVKPVLQDELLEVTKKAVAQNAPWRRPVLSYKELPRGEEKGVGKITG